MPKISVIIPALNEEANIEGAILSALRPCSGIETEAVVVDGGSTDQTATLAVVAGAKLIESEPGRGRQMDAGVRQSSGDILLFLHADTRLPEQWQKAVVKTLATAGISAGAFTLKIDSERFSYRLLEVLVDMRSRILGLIYGDQVIFTTRKTLDATGGFKKLSLFEDVDCVKRLGGAGKVIILKQGVITSPRRFETHGIIKTTARNWLFLCLYKIGFDTTRLYRWYYKNHPNNKSATGS